MTHESPPSKIDALDDGILARRIAESGTPGCAEEEVLCRRLARPVRLYGLRHLKSEEAAQDLVQDAMLLTLEKLRSGQVREPEKIGSFVLGIARMLSRSRWRGRGRETLISEEIEASLIAPADPVEPPERHILVRCLEMLRESQRAVVVLTYYGAQSSDEIAASLGLSAANVRVIRHRAMKSLRDCVEAEGGVRS